MIRCTNDVIMHRLVAALQALGERDWFDYIAVAAPLFLSAVAIWISISAAKKQNRIALFTIRHDAIVDIRTILLFESKIQGDIENIVIKVMFDGLFGTSVTDANEKEAIVQILSTTTRLEKSTMVKILVRKKQADEIYDVLTSMKNMMINVVADIDALDDKKEFHNNCKKLLEGSYKDLCKKVRI